MRGMRMRRRQMRIKENKLKADEDDNWAADEEKMRMRRRQMRMGRMS